VRRLASKAGTIQKGASKLNPLNRLMATLVPVRFPVKGGRDSQALPGPVHDGLGLLVQFSRLANVLEHVDQHALVGDLGLAAVVDQQTGGLFLGAGEIPSHQHHQVHRGDAAILLPNVGQNLLLFGQRIRWWLRRPEHELEDLLVKRLVRQPSAPPSVRATIVAWTQPHIQKSGQVKSMSPPPLSRSSELRRANSTAINMATNTTKYATRVVTMEILKRKVNPLHRASPTLASLSRSETASRRVKEGSNLIDQFAALGRGEMTAKFLEQATKRVFGNRHRKTGLRDRVGLGQLTALPLQGFEQNAARLALGV